MPSDRTRASILDAAERLYADRGFAYVTLRAFVAAADVNLAAAMRRPLPNSRDADLYWGLHFALAMAHQTIRDSERLTKLSEGICDLNDVAGVIERIVAVSVMALTGRAVEGRKSETVPARAPYR